MSAYRWKGVVIYRPHPPCSTGALARNASVDNVDSIIVPLSDVTIDFGIAVIEKNPF